MNILSQFNSEELYVINLIKKECIDCNIKVYLVGGIMRDFLLNKKPRDIDISVECNPINIIERMSYIKEYKYHEKFHTSTILFKNGIIVDLIRCRKEKYDFPGALPNIIPSDIYDDLYRRDFTINAIAYDIIDNKIIDPYNGNEDLKNKIVKKVHMESYSEDPTRIYRAIRYASRYNFRINDIQEISKCIKGQVFKTISIDRIIREIVMICSEDNWINCLALCNELQMLDIDINWLNKSKLCSYSSINDKIIGLFISIRNKKHRELFINNSILKRELKSAFKNYEDLNYRLNRLIFNELTNFDIYNILSKLNEFEIKLISFNRIYKYIIINYFKNLSNISLEINGKYLAELGLNNGKQYKKILRYLLTLKLNTGIFDEKNYLHKN
ncbi:CCA tRNA nucleotidyltransferase [Clostridium bovifaecis]|uniref:CCA tRNA nucleotidyltransferase n=1 Tax=Clostridium bovifaecis TaxID=2184719 RepID=A0A6I6F457_9CLOT|nr:CCA tRNA nucleotidyltransferase [Clostridium bovifaecis]